MISEKQNLNTSEVEQARLKSLLDLAPKFCLYKINYCANYQNNNSNNGQSKSVLQYICQ